MNTLFLQTDLIQFFGRFHPLLVHLPIGFIILSALLEFINRKQKTLEHAIELGLLTGGLVGLFASVLGWLLSLDGGYNEVTLNWHMWSAILASLLSITSYLVRSRNIKAYWASLALTLVLLTIAGHNGGNLTHGSQYLTEHAPVALKKLVGAPIPRTRNTSMDSALIFDDAVLYILDTKCNVCHNNDKAKGDLIMTNANDLLVGGENGPVIEAGISGNSELIRRVLLDPNHDDFMPTEGRTPLTPLETQLLIWWIDQGAPIETRFSELTLNEEIELSLKEIGIGETKSYIERTQVKALDKSVIDALISNGFKVSPVMSISNLLDISYSGALGPEQMKALEEAASHITWLSLSGTDLNDLQMSSIGQMPHLTRLKIDQTQIGNEGVAQLTQNLQLEYLNLYGTSVSDEIIPVISQLPNLRQLYLWQTQLTEEGIARVKEANTNLEVVD